MGLLWRVPRVLPLRLALLEELRLGELLLHRRLGQRLVPRHPSIVSTSACTTMIMTG